MSSSYDNVLFSYVRAMSFPLRRPSLSDIVIKHCEENNIPYTVLKLESEDVGCEGSPTIDTHS